MDKRNVVVLVVDRLQAAQVGAYGNTWIRTPQLDRLAAESLLLDCALADALELDLLYRGLWQGLPGRLPPQSVATGPWLPALVSAAGLHTALLER